MRLIVYFQGMILKFPLIVPKSRYRLFCEMHFLRGLMDPLLYKFAVVELDSLVVAATTAVGSVAHLSKDGQKK